ncbi:enoyl-CoA hydratase/isomerase family protein [SAR202 cluster bacterium AD-804-J14_MRT_500m]|nr:enoyl-CoA hydratase/isomerase family protein [SAR202 cluster bacterium AD-804-J14_MRT_500m]
MSPSVLYEIREPGVVLITLNRPAALNAINRSLKKELANALSRFDSDSTSQVAVITGAGRAFCAGRDLKERADDNSAGIQASASDSMLPDSPYMFDLPQKPLIAAINGYALAGGWLIAQMCDLRIASDEARLGITEAKVGLLPPFAATLPKLIPMTAALELVFTGSPISAQRALEIGFLNRVVPQENLISTAMGMARSIAANAPLSLRYFKRMAYAGLDLPQDQLGRLVKNLYDELLLSADSKEGPRAFSEKRKPQWQGR